MKLISNPDVNYVFHNYPKPVRQQLLYLRKLILTTASEIDGLEKIEETLKWGEPSYLTKYGSTVRLGWKKKNPKQFAIYFQCTSKLVPTFKTIYKKEFHFEGNRAIVFNLRDTIPETALKQCTRMALTYHKIKHLPFLGAH